MNLEILQTANQLIKGANFTKIVKARKNPAPSFLIVNKKNFSLYASYSSEAVYVIDNNGKAFQLK